MIIYNIPISIHSLSFVVRKLNPIYGDDIDIKPIHFTYRWFMINFDIGALCAIGQSIARARSHIQIHSHIWEQRFFFVERHIWVDELSCAQWSVIASLKMLFVLFCCSNIFPHRSMYRSNGRSIDEQYQESEMSHLKFMPHDNTLNARSVFRKYFWYTDQKLIWIFTRQINSMLNDGFFSLPYSIP